ncbi:hypothetical protein POM88_053021 [Heracleum sosnowskyi]|uniref:Histidine-containing phosphotransfer protein n=1 Tax=Heracleum sosnowskyi TaxID=360622 RepID=A0AAD8GR60_9APIA|nr:hypothetical protein POM88_053017 [Heracleum sosnowskyi]KAK1352590.1 hypothetical protein POM88_053021 [Heracleum sosnowskyi]
MDSLKQLQRQYVQFVKSLYRERIVDRQFVEMQKMQKDDPDFLSGIANNFFDMWESVSHKIDIAIEQKIVDPELYDAVHRVKGAGMSLGVKKVITLCLDFQEHYNTRNHEGCLQCLPQIKDDYQSVKDKLQMVFGLQQQIIGAGGSIPILG